MRILLLTQAYPPFIGGSERFAQDLADELIARGHHVAVVTYWREGLPYLNVEGGVSVYRIRGSVHAATGVLFKDPSRVHAPPIADPGALLELRRIIRREEPQIIHAIDWLVHSFVPLKGQSRAGLVMTLQDYSLACAKKTLIRGGANCQGPSVAACLSCAMAHYGVTAIPTVLGRRLTEPALKRAVDMFVPVSTAVAAGTGLARSGARYRIVPNFVRGQGELDGGAVDGLPRGEFLLYVGGLSRKKGVDVLLEAYARIEGAPPLVLIGYSTVEDPVSTDRLPNGVVLLRDVPHDDVMRAWSRCLVGLVPSVWPEPFGIVAIEAMLAGRPVVASGAGGLSDIVVDGETGILVPPGDADALSQAMRRLLGNPAYREGLGQAGKNRVRRYEARAVIPQYEDIYRDVIDRAER